MLKGRRGRVEQRGVERLALRLVDCDRPREKPLPSPSPMWASSSGSGRSLHTTLDTLHRHAGFKCFWQGDAKPAPHGANSSLVAVDSGAAWCEAYEFRGWSNLICAHTDDRSVVTALDELARKQ